MTSQVSLHTIRKRSRFDLEEGDEVDTQNPVITYKPEMQEFITILTVSCKHCGKTGHTEEACWNKYPEKQPRGIKIKTKQTCYKCGEVGHIQKYHDHNIKHG